MQVAGGGAYIAGFLGAWSMMSYMFLPPIPAAIIFAAVREHLVRKTAQHDWAGTNAK
ncbi:MAG TPA: hypothetical protein VJV22_16480 [Acidobacteriaceae bacterium]|nr:hypothetical protein [Acidobacteriaceae bacterium]